MKTYTPQYKKLVTEIWDVTFSIETEFSEPAIYHSTKAEAFAYLKELMAREGDEFINRLQLAETFEEEVEDEPGWDMLPGGHDYDG